MMKAVFLDRDGVLNELIYYPDFGEDESPRTAVDLRLLPGILDALRELQSAGWTLFLISNQPSYAKGKTSLADLETVHKALLAQVTIAGISVEACYYSYTHPHGIVADYTTESMYRKPNPGFVFEAARDYEVDLRSSWFVGDRDTDIQCGQRAGTRTALIRYPLSRDKQGTSKPDLICKDLPDFVRQLTQQGGT
jgi:D-glycero-D-manno-heptose 1,7-bisphosphate phosphatase